MDTSSGTSATVPSLTGNFCYHAELVGPLQLQFRNGFLLRLVYSVKDVPEQESPCLPSGHPVTVALDAYFSGDPHLPEFLRSIPLVCLPGTPFQHRVREAIMSIPYGETMSYGRLAAALGTSPRAIGQACRWNPVAIIIPCHRVILSSQGPGGYVGDRKGELWRRKLALLRHEGVEL